MSASSIPQQQRQFGTAPVFLTSISTILGTVLFLRFGYAVGNVGFAGALLIILIGHMVTIPTAMALAEIATNQRVEGGGEYYIISRAFGVTIGAAIGLALFASQAISVAFYIIGFAESFEPAFDLLRMKTGIVIADKRVISLPVLFLLTVLMFTRGAKVGVRALYVVVSILFVSLASFFLGGPVEGASGVLSADAFTRTVDGPDPFFVVFAIVFPAFTGMTAGVGLSGDLRDTRRSIPLGVLAATLFGMLVYVAATYKFAVSMPPEILNDRDNLVMSRIALWGPIIPLGLAAATLASAIGSLLVAPRTLQALASDGAFPSSTVNRWLAYGKGETREPTHGTVIVATIALAFVTIGGIDSVARIISLIFMVTYGSLCLISFLEHFAASPAYRPTFRSPWYISLLGAGMCVWLMFRMSPGYAVIAILAMIALYFVISSYNPQRRNIASMFQGVIFQISRQLHVFLQGHQDDREDVWHPSVVCISDVTFDRLAAFDLLRWISHKYGFGTYIHYIPGHLSRAGVLESRSVLKRLLHMTEIAHGNVFVDTLVSPSYRTAIGQAIQLPGFSGKDNNMVLFEYAAKAPTHLAEIIDTYQMINCTDFDVAILASSDRSFGYRRDIHVWAKPGEFENARLMIMLAFIILGHTEWRNAEMKIFVLFPENEPGEHVEGLLELIGSGRLPISIRNIELVPQPPDVDKKIVISERSREADLTILGFQGELLRHERARVFQGYEGLGDVLFINSNREHRVDLESEPAPRREDARLSERLPDGPGVREYKPAPYLQAERAERDAAPEIPSIENGGAVHEPASPNEDTDSGDDGAEDSGAQSSDTKDDGAATKRPRKGRR